MTFEAELNGLDFAEIDATLARARTAIEQAQQLSLGDLNPAALLGDLGIALEAAGQVRLDATSINQIGGQALSALGSLVTLPDLSGLEEVVEGLERLAEGLAVPAAVFSGSGDGKAVLDRVFRALSGSLDLETLLGEITDRAVGAFDVSIPDEFAGPMRALSALAGDPKPAELLEILGTVFTGLDIAAVGRLVGAAESALALVVGAGDAGPLQIAVDAVHLRLDAAYQLMAVPVVDVSALLKAIDEVGFAVDVVGTALPRFAAGLGTDLRTAGNLLSGLDLTGSLDGLVAALPLPGEDMPRELVASLDGMAQFLEQLDGAAVTAAIAAMKDELLAAAGLDQLADLLSGLDEVFAQAGAQLDRLPLRKLRDDAVAALVGCQQAVLSFDGFSFLDEAVAPIRDLETKIRTLDTSAVTDSVSTVVDQLNDLLADVDVTPVRDAVAAVIGPLGDIVERLVPFVEQVADQLKQVVDQLNGIDFDVAGTATLDLLHGIREQVADAVGGGDVPEPVKAVVAAAAAVLRELDLSAKLTAPFGDAVATIDVSALVAPLEGTWHVAGEALAKATPAALIAELDPPFADLVAALDGLSLAPLIDAVQRLFDDAVTELRALDPRTLVAPLEARFQDLVRELTAALDPAPLFAPVHAAYRALHELLDEIDVAATLHSVLGGLADMPHQMSSRLGGRLQEGLSGAAPAAVAAAGFQLGDVLRPLALFLGEVRVKLARLGAGVLGPVLAELAAATRGLRELTDTATGFAVRLGDAVDTRMAWLSPTSGSGPLAQLRTDLESFQMAMQTLDVSAGARVQLTASAGAVQFDARVHVDAHAEATEQASSLRGTADSAALGRSLRLLGRALDEALPAELVTGGLDPLAAIDAFLDAVFDRVDPSDLADQLDAIGARIEARFVALAAELANGLFLVVDAVFASIEPLMPASVIKRLQDGIDAVLARFTALDPTPIEDEVRAVVHAAISLLAVHSPAALAAELGYVFDACIARIAALSPATLFAGADPFAPVKAQLETMKPSDLLSPLVAETKQFTVALDTIASIDLTFAVGAVDELKLNFATVLDGVQREWNALLDELARISGGVSVSVSVG
ncbi:MULTISPECIES: hypothetical protein [unclassified Mycobacterium]|uniref:hypothetical protein n=1 Tax=unclassified Mycobacterium TaxID=2642494 RepID=UPI0029C6CA54|nr:MULTISPECIES: hypothetical protein [unclassified Mycobacterium]